MSRYRFTAQEKYEILESVNHREGSLIDSLIPYGISTSTYDRWKFAFESFGLKGLSPSPKNSSYTSELKLAAVQAYLNGEGSLNEISRKYNLRSVNELLIANLRKRRLFGISE